MIFDLASCVFFILPSLQLHFEVPLSPVIAAKKARPSDGGSDEVCDGRMVDLDSLVSPKNITSSLLSGRKLCVLSLQDWDYLLGSHYHRQVKFQPPGGPVEPTDAESMSFVRRTSGNV